MEAILHILGLCPDHGSHVDLINSLTMFNVSDLYWEIQKVYLSLSIRINNLWKK
jgi:hypothetical protein